MFRQLIIGLIVVATMSLALVLALRAAQRQQVFATSQPPPERTVVLPAATAGAKTPPAAPDRFPPADERLDALPIPYSDSPGLLLVQDGFTGSGPLRLGRPSEDIEGGGWQSAESASQPLRDGGRLVSGGTGSLGSIQLPPISPHGEITMTAAVTLRGGSGITLGFTKSVADFTGANAGPFVQLQGTGQVEICADATTRTQANIPARSTDGDRVVTLVLHQRLWDRSLRVSADGVELAAIPLAKTGDEFNRYATVGFAGGAAKDCPTIEALRIDYVPVQRPVKLVPHRTVTVTDTSREGILKAIGDANAKTGPDNIIEISIPKGDYVFTVPAGTKRDHVFSTYGLKYMLINWNGSTITIAEPDLGFQCLSDGRNVTVANIASVDYPQGNLPFTQGTVCAVDQEGRTFDLEIDPGFPLPDNAYLGSRNHSNSERWGQLLDPEQPGRQPAGVKREYWIKDIRRLQDRVYRYTLNEPQMPGFRIGSRFADCPRSGNEIFRVFNGDGVRLENITGHSCPNFWSMIYFSRISYHNVRVLLKPGRLMSANGDLVTGVDNLLWMERSHFEGNADDICHQFRGRGTFIADTVFRNNRRFGVWFNTASFGVVKDCLFDGVGFHAISGMKEPGMDEGGQWGSRNIICIGNRIQNVRDPGIFLNSCHTRQDSSSHWNISWRVLRNASTTAIRIHNATDIRLIGNTDGSGRLALLDIDRQNTRDVKVITTAP